jgi:hypothetical protein
MRYKRICINGCLSRPFETTKTTQDDHNNRLLNFIMRDNGIKESFVNLLITLLYTCIFGSESLLTSKQIIYFLTKKVVRLPQEE